MASFAYTKVDIVHALADRYGYRRYLEIATPTTGLSYRRLDATRFDDRRRLMYVAPPGFTDGMPIDYAVPGEDSGPGIAVIRAQGRRFDIIFVDPYHTYEATARDLASAFGLLDHGGSLVVHDCLPPDEGMTSPTFNRGPWCGVTYQAFVDFVIARGDRRYLTVDTDYGCGVVRKIARPLRDRLALPFGGEGRLATEWRKATAHGPNWPFFAARHRELLKLVSVDEFQAGTPGLD